MGNPGFVERGPGRPGVWGRLEAPVGSRAKPWWGVQEGEAPESSQVLRCFKLDLTYYKNDKKTKINLTFF